eukprot:6027071-Prymnesium_polylepis.1
MGFCMRSPCERDKAPGGVDVCSSTQTPSRRAGCACLRMHGSSRSTVMRPLEPRAAGVDTQKFSLTHVTPHAGQQTLLSSGY